MLCGCNDDDSGSPVSSAMIQLSVDRITTGLAGGVYQVTVTGSGDWRLSGFCDWVHVSSESGKSGETVTFTVAPNDTDMDRIATYKFFTGSAVARLTIEENSGTILDLLSDTELAIDAKEQVVTVKIHTNTPSLTYQTPEWMSFVSRQEVFGSTLLTFQVNANESGSRRASGITVNGSDFAKPLQVKVVQEPIPVLSVDKSLHRLTTEDQIVEVSIDANIEYDVVSGCAWIQRVENSDEKVLKFHIDATSEEKRSGKVSIIYTFDPEMSVDLTFNQFSSSITWATEIEDDNFRTWLLDEGWILDAGDGYYAVSDVGLAATALAHNASSSNVPKFSSLIGIENFPELESISLNGDSCLSIDLSGLKKVKTLSLTGTGMMKFHTLILGANPITEYIMPNSFIGLQTPAMTISGDYLETVDVSITQPYYLMGNKWETLDVSGCPALKSLNCIRGNTSKPDKLVTVYLPIGSTADVTKSETTTIEYK